MSTTKVLKWVSGGLEALLAIPVVGGAIVMGLFYLPLLIMLALHIVTLVLSAKEGVNKHGSILGIITSAVAWIPFVGWILHVLTAVFLMVDAAKQRN